MKKKESLPPGNYTAKIISIRKMRNKNQYKVKIAVKDTILIDTIEPKKIK